MNTDASILLRIAQRLHATADVTVSRVVESDLPSGSGARVRRLSGQVCVHGSVSDFSVVTKSMPLSGVAAGRTGAAREHRFYTTLAPLVSPLAVPVCYDSVVENGAVVLFLEDVSAHSEHPTSLSDYALVARQVGRFNARATATPDPSWALDAPLAAWTRGATADLLPDIRAVLRESGATASLTDLLADIVRWRERLLDLVAALPTVTCHNDLSRRNVFVRREPAPRVSVIDWASIGRCAVGAELSVLIGGTVFMGDTLPASTEAVERTTLTEYCQGLRDEGCDVDPQTALKGYAAASSLRMIRRAFLLRSVRLDPANGEQWMRRAGCTTDEMVRRFAAWLPRSHRFAQIALD